MSDFHPELISIAHAAKITHVSSATIRNWIKAGYLAESKKGHITKESLLQFVDESIGKTKLNSRANKLQKDTHNHAALSEVIAQKAGSSVDNTAFLELYYESSLSESYKNKEGIYYTPDNIVTDMLASISVSEEAKTFLDPCCGGGNFIMGAIELGFNPENIYGFDTDINAVAITKKRIFDKTGIASNNIIHANFLEIAASLNQEFDFIFTNPPWGKKLEKEQKEQIATTYQAGKSIDTSALFFFACLNCLPQNGKLGFLMPESFFAISTFQDARIAALKLTIERLIDYGKPFKGLVTKAQAIILSNRVDTECQVTCQLLKQTHVRSLKSFKQTPKNILNFWIDEASSEVISHIYTKKHITLAANAEWALGIITGDNSKFCKDKWETDYIPVSKGSDISPSGLKEPRTFIPKNRELYQQVAPNHFYDAPEKLIYKFISSNLCFYFDTEQRYILNSANLLVLKKHFPITGKQLADLLNSEFLNWLFQSIFSTHKVLRGDLELLPIHADYFTQYETFEEASFLNYLNIEKIGLKKYRLISMKYEV